MHRPVVSMPIFAMSVFSLHVPRLHGPPFTPSNVTVKGCPGGFLLALVDPGAWLVGGLSCLGFLLLPLSFSVVFPFCLGLFFFFPVVGSLVVFSVFPFFLPRCGFPAGRL